MCIWDDGCKEDRFKMYDEKREDEDGSGQRAAGEIEPGRGIRGAGRMLPWQQTDWQKFKQLSLMQEVREASERPLSVIKLLGDAPAPIHPSLPLAPGPNRPT